MYAARIFRCIQSPFNLSASFILTAFIIMQLTANFTLALEKAPNFTLTDIEGEVFSLSDYQGAVVILDFFATYCAPCIDEIPHLRAIFNDYNRSQLVILSVGVNPSESDALLKDFAQAQNMVWRVARDSIQVSDEYGVSYIPTLVIVDSDGYRRFSHVGLTAESVLRNEVDSLLSGGENNGNGDSNGSSNGLPLNLILVTAAGISILLIIGLVVVGRSQGWDKPAKKRRS
jgi:thiol-disulfide isomerase/thioredoxin